MSNADEEYKENKNKQLLSKRAEYAAQHDFIYGKIEMLEECVKELGFNYEIMKSN